jgi:hypothetical protein
LVEVPFSMVEIARVIENWALAMSPLVLAVGSQVEADCAARGAAAALRDKAAAILVTKTLIKELPDL